MALPGPIPETRHDWETIKTLLPYLWAWKGRVVIALTFLLLAKLTNVGVPLVFKDIIDTFTVPGANRMEQAVLLVPLGLLAAYGALRFSTVLFTELREIFFARVTQRAVRTITLQVFEHLHALSLRFHLDRQTGGLTRDIERGTRSIGSLISYTLYSILPTLVEILLVLGILGFRYDKDFMLITLVTLVLYVTFTIIVTNWRTVLRREVNELDSAANVRAVDSLINFETVKYFNNERWEHDRYDEQMQKWETAQIRSQISLSWLNLGQSLIIAAAVTLMMWRAAVEVVAGRMTVGDIVLVNAFLIQLYMPLNHLGVLYREIRQSLTDIERMFSLLGKNREIQDAPDARPLFAAGESGPCEVEFDHVGFAYESNRQILFDVNFKVGAGRTVAVVGHSGSGKSTLARLLVPLLRHHLRLGENQRLGPACTAAGFGARRDRHRAAGHGAVQRHDLLQHPVRPTGGPARGSHRRRPGRAYPQFHRGFARRLRDAGRRTRPQALRRREAARGDCPGTVEEPADPDFRRGHLGTGFQDGKGHPGPARAGRRGPHHADHRPPPVHGDERRRDPGARCRAHRRARRPSHTARARWPILANVGLAAAGI